MKALIQVRPDTDIVMDEIFENAAQAMSSGDPSDPVAVITFSSPSQLFTVISPKRWELVEHLQKIGPVSVRGLARSLGRDVKRVHEDVTTLLEWSIVERSEDGRVYVPFDVIHAGFDLSAAA
jgi:predicted transcriptional regulator